MIHAVDGQQRRWADIEPLATGFLAVCELEARLHARLDANIAAAEMALQAARAEPWVKGSTGQPKPHPGFAVAKACDETALALYREITRGVDDMIPVLANCLRLAPPPSTLSLEE
jgi:Ser/Thr protein kinase RdoA (MazF antagonist)